MKRNWLARLAVICTCLTIAGCSTPQAYTQWRETAKSAFTVDAIKRDPESFLAEHTGKRVVVEGYFVVDRITDGFRVTPGDQFYCDHDAISGDDQKHIYLELPLSKVDFQSTVLSWVVVEAKVMPPRQLAVGGGDLIVPIDPRDLHLILEDGKLIAVDAGRAPCLRGAGPATP